MDQLRQVMLRQEEKKEKLFSKHKDERLTCWPSKRRKRGICSPSRRRKGMDAMKYKPAAAKQPPGAPECPV